MLFLNLIILGKYYYYTGKTFLKFRNILRVWITVSKHGNPFGILTLCCPSLGIFPLCTQCNETCYGNWYKLIDIERERVNELAQNVTDVSQTFNGTSAADINQTLSDLNAKLKYSEDVFSGAQASTKVKEDQFKRVGDFLVHDFVFYLHVRLGMLYYIPGSWLPDKFY